jgi:hypothetical protein
LRVALGCLNQIGAGIPCLRLSVLLFPQVGVLVTGLCAVLDSGEATYARARIGSRSLRAPVDRQLYVELQQFLDEVAFRACDALEELAEGADLALRRRLHLLLGIEGER